MWSERAARIELLMAFLRAFMGVIFLSVWSYNLGKGYYSPSGWADFVQHYADTTKVGLYADLLNKVMIPNSAIFAYGQFTIEFVVFGLFLQHPLLGTGLGTSRGVLLQLFPASWSGAVHNEYLRLLSETGLLGFGLFAAAVLGWTRDAARAARRADPLVREFALAAVGAAVVWGVTALTDNALDWYNQYAQHVVFLLAATTAAVRLSIQHARATAPPAASGPTAGSGATEAVRE